MRTFQRHLCDIDCAADAALQTESGRLKCGNVHQLLPIHCRSGTFVWWERSFRTPFVHTVEKFLWNSSLLAVLPYDFGCILRDLGEFLV